MASLFVVALAAVVLVSATVAVPTSEYSGDSGPGPSSGGNIAAPIARPSQEASARQSDVLRATASASRRARADWDGRSRRDIALTFDLADDPAESFRQCFSGSPNSIASRFDLALALWATSPVTQERSSGFAARSGDRVWRYDDVVAPTFALPAIPSASRHPTTAECGSLRSQAVYAGSVSGVFTGPDGCFGDSSRGGPCLFGGEQPVIVATALAALCRAFVENGREACHRAFDEVPDEIVRAGFGPEFWYSHPATTLYRSFQSGPTALRLFLSGRQLETPLSRAEIDLFARMLRGQPVFAARRR